MELEERQRGHSGILGLQSSISQGLWKEGGSLLTAFANLLPPGKRGSSKKIEINMLKVPLDILSTLTYLHRGCQSKK
jgi:hypothetical protein